MGEVLEAQSEDDVPSWFGDPDEKALSKRHLSDATPYHHNENSLKHSLPHETVQMPSRDQGVTRMNLHSCSYPLECVRLRSRCQKGAAAVSSTAPKPMASLLSLSLVSGPILPMVTSDDLESKYFNLCERHVDNLSKLKTSPTELQNCRSSMKIVRTASQKLEASLWALRPPRMARLLPEITSTRPSVTCKL